MSVWSRTHYYIIKTANQKSNVPRNMEGKCGSQTYRSIFTATIQCLAFLEQYRTVKQTGFFSVRPQKSFFTRIYSRMN